MALGKALRNFVSRFGPSLGAAEYAATYNSATSGAQTLAAASSVKDRAALIVIKVTEAFADNGGSQPTFTLGETGSATKFSAAALLTDAAKDAIFVRAGIVDQNDALLVTAVAAAGAGKGAIAVRAILLPASA